MRQDRALPYLFAEYQYNCHSYPENLYTPQELQDLEDL